MLGRIIPTLEEGVKAFKFVLILALRQFLLVRTHPRFDIFYALLDRVSIVTTQEERS